MAVHRDSTSVGIPPIQGRRMNSLVVAGDICLDVLGIPVPPPPGGEIPTDNWRQSGETRTHYLPGGALLLEMWVRAAAGGCSVVGSRPCRPSELGHRKDEVAPLNLEEFLALAERLTRDEIVHSLLAVDSYLDGKGDNRRLRVRAT